MATSRMFRPGIRPLLWRILNQPACLSQPASNMCTVALQEQQEVGPDGRVIKYQKKRELTWIEKQLSRSYWTKLVTVDVIPKAREVILKEKIPPPDLVKVEHINPNTPTARFDSHKIDFDHCKEHYKFEIPVMYWGDNEWKKLGLYQLDTVSRREEFYELMSQMQPHVLAERTKRIDRALTYEMFGLVMDKKDWTKEEYNYFEPYRLRKESEEMEDKMVRALELNKGDVKGMAYRLDNNMSKIVNNGLFLVPLMVVAICEFMNAAGMV